MDEDGFPPLATMVDDLAKVDGLGGWFSLMAAVLEATPSLGIVTDEELAAFKRAGSGQNAP